MLFMIYKLLFEKDFELSIEPLFEYLDLEVLLSLKVRILLYKSLSSGNKTFISSF